MDNFGRFVRSLDDSIRQLYYIGDANAKRHQDCKLTEIYVVQSHRLVVFALHWHVKLSALPLGPKQQDLNTGKSLFCNMMMELMKKISAISYMSVHSV